MFSANTTSNLPANTFLHKAMEANHPTMKSDIANNCRRFFRFTIDIIERAIKRILGKDTTEPSRIQKAISIRTISATNMLNNASLPLDNNKNLRAHRANLKEMLDMHPDATAVSLFSVNQRFTNSTYHDYKNRISMDDKNKLNVYDLPHHWGPIEFKGKDDIAYFVDDMLSGIEKQFEESFKDNKEIKIIIETPPFLVSKNQPFTAKECAQEYITACEAWQLHLQGKYGKKVTILPFRSPENLNNKKHEQFTKNNNDAYDDANAALAKISKGNRETELLQYIANIVSQQHIDDIELQQHIDDIELQPQEEQFDSISLSSIDDNEGYEGSIITSNQTDTSFAVSPSNQGIRDTSTILADISHNEDRLNRDLQKTKEGLEDNKKKNRLSDEATKDFSKIKDLEIYSGSLLIALQNTNINRDILINCKNEGKQPRDEQNENNIELPEIAQDYDDLFFLHPIDKYNVITDTDRKLSYKCKLYLKDSKQVMKFAEDNNIDAGKAVFMYFSILEENIFDNRKLDHYIFSKQALVLNDMHKHLNADNSLNDPYILSYLVDLIIPDVFLDALENSKDPEISSLVKEYGAANVIYTRLLA